MTIDETRSPALEGGGIVLVLILVLVLVLDAAFRIPERGRERMTLSRFVIRHSSFVIRHSSFVITPAREEQRVIPTRPMAYHFAAAGELGPRV
jgi:hypothetical protein